MEMVLSLLRARTMTVQGLIVILLVVFKPSVANIDIHGDVTIVGMFSIHEPDTGQCGHQIRVESVMAAEAVKWYLQNLNDHGELPLKIGFKAYETCRVGAIASEIAIDVMHGTLRNASIIGILGPEFSSEAEEISPILSSVSEDKMLAQVGFSTTATRLLATPGKNPNFVRVIPNDGIQIEAMVQAMLALEWNRIAVLYEEDLYGRDGAELLKSQAEKDGICVSYVKGMSVQNGIDIIEINKFLNDVIIGEELRPGIGGIVFIGSTATARALFNAMQVMNIAPLPIVMLSEGINLNTNVFKNNRGLLSKSKGSLALSPPYTDISEFTRHLKNIFTNDTKKNIEAETNPWLLAVDEESQVVNILAEQPLNVQYAVRAAHALVKSVVLSHTNYCSQPGICPSFVAKFRTGEMVTRLKGLEIDFATDFKWRLQDTPPMFSINETGEVTTPATSPSYELYNFRSTNSSSSEFKLTKVGDFINGKLNVHHEFIRDYTAQGKELEWPDIRKAQCAEGSKCVDCLFVDELPERTLFIPGDMYLVGIVPVYNTDGQDGCSDIRTISGYQGAESIRFAIQNVNTKTGDFDGFFSDLRIGLILINSCNNQVVVQRKIFDLYENGITLHDNTKLSVKDKIIGFVGDVGSSISIAVAETLSRLKFVQISYASTNPTLSDRKKYPYFMRVVTPDDIQARAMMDILKKLDINYIQIIYSEGAYGEGGRDKVKEQAKLNKICVVREIAVDEKSSEYGFYDLLLENSHARLVIVFLRSHMVNVIMTALAKQIEERGKRGEFLFIGSETWANKPQVLDNEKSMALLGSYSLSLEIYQDKQLRAHIQGLEPEPFIANPWLSQYLQAKRNCYFDFGFDKKTYPEICSSLNDYSSKPDFTLDSWDTSAYVAAESLLMGANELFQTKCGSAANGLCAEFTDNPEDLVNEILKVKLDLDGSGNKIKVFNENSDGNVGYRIYNIQRDKDEPQKLVYASVGRYPLDGTFTFETDKVVYPTTDEFVSKCPNEKACSECFQDSPEQNRLDNRPDNDDLDIGIIILGALLATAVIVIIVLVLIVIRNYRYHYADKTIYLHPTTSSSDNSPYFDNSIADVSEIPPCRPSGQTDNEIQTTDT